MALGQGSNPIAAPDAWSHGTCAHARPVRRAKLRLMYIYLSLSLCNLLIVLYVYIYIIYNHDRVGMCDDQKNYYQPPKK